jgi:hypothetical protein
MAGKKNQNEGKLLKAALPASSASSEAGDEEAWVCKDLKLFPFMLDRKGLHDLEELVAEQTRIHRQISEESQERLREEGGEGSHLAYGLGAIPPQEGDEPDEEPEQ